MKKIIESNEFLKKIFSSGNERSLILKKNIFGSFIIKGLNILIGFILIPLTINYVSPSQYGIWIAINSAIGWFAFFDIGLGNGLKNNLGEALAKGDNEQGKTYVSTTYAYVAMMAILFFIIFFTGSQFINWASFLNISKADAMGMQHVSLIVCLIFCCQFSLQLISTVSLTMQNSLVGSYIVFFTNVISITITYILVKTTTGSLINLCLSIGVPTVLVLLTASIMLYRGKYKAIAPSFRYINFKLGRNIIKVGVGFFIIQIGLLFLYNVDNVIISKTNGPEAVTTYNVAFRYFSVISTLSAIIMGPLWTAFIDAHHKNDTAWIQSNIKRLEQISIGIFAISLLMLAVAAPVYKIWIKNGHVVVPFAVSAVLAFYTSLNAYRTIYVSYLNALGKIRIQTITILCSAVLNIIFGMLLGRYWGIAGVIFTSAVLCSISCVIEIIQYRKLVNNCATGIWNK